jgi:hypothetical protein
MKDNYLMKGWIRDVEANRDVEENRDGFDAVFAGFSAVSRRG